MKLLERIVIVKKLPQNCDGHDGREFLHELAHAMAQTVRPAVVLDCSGLRKIDKPVLNLVLCCLEGAMKRNGDVRLAGLHPDAWPVIEFTGAGSLFKSFRSTAEAVNSYRRPAFDRAASIAEPQTDSVAANAA